MSKKIVIASLIGMVIFGLGVSVWLYRYMVQRPTFVAIPVEKSTFHAVVSADGKVVPEKTARLGFEQMGKIATLAYAVGDVVKQDAIVASLDATGVTAQLRQAQALRQSALANVNQYQSLVKKEKAKLDSLRKTAGTNSADKRAQKRQIDASKAQTEAQKSQVDATLAGADNAKAQVRKTVLTAPFDGIITQQDVNTGEIATPGESIVTLASRDAFKVEVFVSQTQIQNIHIGDTAHVTLDTIPGVFTTRVTAIDPAETENNTVSSYKVVLHFEGNAPALRSGMNTTVEIAVASREDVVAIPEKSIFESDGKAFVYLSREGKSEQREVTTGLHGSDGQVEIVSGLQAGDMIFK